MSFVNPFSRRRFLGATAVSLTLPLNGCATRPRRFRYRLTLQVATPEGSRSGSGVVEIAEGYNDGLLDLLSQTAVVFGTRGEAVIVDLGARGLLFALLNADDEREGSRTVFDALSRLHEDLWDPNGIGPGAMDRMAKLRGETQIPFEMLPMLVRFRDISDPITVERVEPDDFESVFGAGVKLIRASVEITDDEVTTGIEKILGWIARLHGSIANMLGLSVPYLDLLNRLNDGSFRQGMRP
ncbi:MAG: hypothetical protein ACLPIC_02665 [Rhodoblastus sp.]|uniref:hypothetical protein n=1 Tax=Rhodoblastus sp. TaxID=1962975 RepID=UPI003F9DB35D